MPTTVNKQTLVIGALSKCIANMSSHRMQPSDRKFLEKFEVTTEGIRIKRIAPRKCNPEKCGCGEIHWSIWSEPIDCLKQPEQNKLFEIAYRVAV